MEYYAVCVYLPELDGGKGFVSRFLYSKDPTYLDKVTVSHLPY
jgi:hypothetical protein